jgi:hypothetical protein
MSNVFLGVQVDITFDPGIGLGRFVVARGEDAPQIAAFAGEALPDRGSDVLIVSTSGAPLLPDRRGLSRRPRRRARELATEDVWLTKMTFVRGDHAFADDRGSAVLLGLIADDIAAASLVSEAFAVINRALVAARIATSDPSELALDAAIARAVRIGFADPETINDGRLSSAFAVTASTPGGGWRETVPTTEFVAATLAGRVPVLDVDRLLLRIAADVAEEAHDRAAAQLPGVVGVAIVELRGAWTEDEAEDLRRSADRLAHLGFRGSIGEPERHELTRVVRSLWAAARARSAPPAHEETRDHDEFHSIVARSNG